LSDSFRPSIEEMSMLATQPPRPERSRIRVIVGIAAAIVLIAGLAFVATRWRSDTSTSGTAASDNPLRLVLKDPPQGLVLTGASNRAAGVTGDSYIVALLSRTATVARIPIEARWSSRELPTGDAATVHGVPAVFTGDPGFNLWWAQDGVTFHIQTFYGEKATQRAFLLDLADRVRPGGPADDRTAPPTFTLATVPDGFDVDVSGPGYDMAFRPEGDDSRLARPTLGVTVQVGGPSTAELAPIVGLKEVTVRGATGYTRSDKVSGGMFIELVFDLADNVHVTLEGNSLTQTEMLKVAEGLSVVSENAWLKAMGHLLDPETPATTSG
jgi:hypothetical protein